MYKNKLNNKSSQNVVFSFITIFALLFSCQIYAQKTYYIRSDGNDEWDGESNATAWKSTSKLNMANFFKPGDAILFRRGDKWEDQGFNIKSSGDENNPIVIGAYEGVNSQELPIISGVSDITTEFFPIGNNIYSTPCNYPPGRLFKDKNGNGEIDDGEELLKAYRDRNNLGHSTYSLKDGCNDKLPIDEWFYDAKQEDSLYVFLEDNPNNLIKKSSNSNNNYYNFSFDSQHDIVVENLNLQGGIECILIGSNYIVENDGVDNLTTFISKSITIKNCKIGAYSSNGVEIRRAEKIIMHDNIFDSKYKLKFGLIQNDCLNTSPSKWTGSDARGNGDAIEVSRYGKYCEFYDNNFINYTFNFCASYFRHFCFIIFYKVTWFITFTKDESL